MRIAMAAFWAACLVSAPLMAQDRITPDVCAVSAAELAVDAGAESAAAPSEVNGTGRFWQVTAPTGQVSYLWGSLHSSDPAILALPEPVQTALGSARVLVLESDPRPKSRTEIAERALQAGVWIAAADGPWDKPWMDGSVRGWAIERIAALTQTDDAFSALTDAGLAYYLMSDPCEDFSAPSVPTQDLRFLLAAHEAGIPVAGLEPWDAFLTEMTQPERQDEARALALVNAAFLDPDQYHQARVAGFRLYLEGRIGQLRAASGAFLAKQFGADEAARLTGLADRYLIGERNRKFVRALGKHLTDGGAMIVVGAFHLPGEGGLIALLQADGYQVSRVPLPGEAR